MNDQDPVAGVRRALAAVRDADRPVGVDREAMLARIVADAQKPPPAKAPAARAWVVAGLGAVALLVAAVASRASRAPTPDPAPTQWGQGAERSRSAAASHGDTHPRDEAHVTSVPSGVTSVPARGPEPLPLALAPPAPAPLAPAPCPHCVGAALGVGAREAREAHAPARAVDDEDEWQILRRADAALRAREPSRALEVLAQHARRHPRSVATPEVMAYRVRALCMLGRGDEARSVAGALVARAPDSPAAYSLRATCVRQP